MSIVIPVLNDAAALRSLLDVLDRLLCGPLLASTEIIVADGGSTDEGPTLAEQRGCVLVRCAASRGGQMQAGFVRAQRQWIWFLHADSAPDRRVIGWLSQSRVPCWGRFDVRFTGRAWLLRMVAATMNWRSRRSGICTGDQGMFVHRSLLSAIGGVPQQPLMEDIELSKRLKRETPPLCPRIYLTTSSRRWEQRGTLRTIVGMWWFRLRYWLGADPERLAAEYYA